MRGSDDPRTATRQAPIKAATFAKGEVLAGKYRIEKVLGRGGMGHVFAARHVDLDQLVAIKVMHRDMLDDADAVMRFGREAKAAASIRDNHAARIFDVGKLDTGQPYMVMEHLEGQDLASMIDRGVRIEIPDAIEWIAQACEAVSEAHELGIVHRDIKPGNLFLTYDRNGRPVIKVLDFGLAKALTPAKAQDLKESTVPTGMALGSPFYMSPEQAMGHRVDHRTDIWSFGATLFQVVTGSPPFNGPNVNIVCAMLLTEDFPSVAQFRRDAPPALDALLRRCMQRDLHQRMGSAREMLDALRAMQAQMQTGRASMPSYNAFPPNDLGKATMRMAPSSGAMPAAPPAGMQAPPGMPPSSGGQLAMKGTLPMSAFRPNVAAPVKAKRLLRWIWFAVPIVFVVATAVVIGVAVYLTR